VTLGNLIFQSV